MSHQEIVNYLKIQIVLYLFSLKFIGYIRNTDGVVRPDHILRTVNLASAKAEYTENEIQDVAF